ncbi:MAG: ATP-dependent DNA helicase [Ferruginibacter sp.]|nr:ATP-dependent DNA helicase [Rhodoferax sp.]
MGLQSLVREVFAPQGALARATEYFQPRQGQLDMALAIGRTIEEGGVLVVEAGTGVGKTFAYLVPALLSGERVLMSTATKTLQDQLFGRDLPNLLKALNLPLRTALLKGRSSYLCLHRLGQARSDQHHMERPELQSLSDIEQWALATRSGDLAELSSLDERSPLLPLITSTRENCLGAQCPQFRACHVNLARREALVADVVVLNHHVFFADLAVRESGMAELLPTARIAIFDEAHQLNETGVQFLGIHLSAGQWLDFARDVLAVGLQQARGLVDWQRVVFAIEQAVRELGLVVGKQSAGTRLRWSGMAPDGVPEAHWGDAMADVVAALQQAIVALDTVTELAPDFVRLHARAVGLAERVQQFSRPCEPTSVRWLEVGLQLRLTESPLDIANAVQTRLLAPTVGARAKSWVFTSATLGDDARLGWFTERCGLQDATCLRVESPFDYATQASLYVPRHLPKPSDQSHSAQVSAFAAAAARQLGGRTMVLTTSLRALRTIGDSLKTAFAGSSEIEVLVQGQWPKRRLMERLRQGGANGMPGCVLVASASFWEGVDVPGEMLQLVIIDKLPFPAPNDPVVEARTQRIEAEGGNPFMDYFVPEAAVALKQGAGRLIRRESDRGVLVVCDTRLAGMGYGKRIQAALPPMRVLKTEVEFQQALQALVLLHPVTTTSTTVSPLS